MGVIHNAKLNLNETLTEMRGRLSVKVYVLTGTALKNI